MLSSQEIQSLFATKDSIDSLIQQEKLSESLLNLLLHHLNLEANEVEEIRKMIKEESLDQSWALLLEILLEKEESIMDEDVEESYSIDALSYYFQVSVQTIEHWIKNERFIGLGPDFDQYTQIDQDIVWCQNEQQQMTIKDVVEHFRVNNEAPELSREDALLEIEIELNSLKVKYNGKPDMILKDKVLSSEEQQDLHAWKHFISLWRQFKDEEDKL